MIDRRTLLASAGMLALGLSLPLQAQDKPTFALVQINQQALFFTQMNEGATQAAEKAGANLVIFNANNDPTAQNNAIETYIQQKVNGIIVVAIDTNGIMPAVKAADAAGIPVVAVDAVLPADGPQKAQIGVDNEGAGKSIGEHFVKYVNECREMGISVLPPDVNRSGMNFTVEGEGTVRFGLSAVTQSARRPRPTQPGKVSCSNRHGR